jgi:hypothetical protein
MPHAVRPSFENQGRNNVRVASRPDREIANVWGRVSRPGGEAAAAATALVAASSSSASGFTGCVPVPNGEPLPLKAAEEAPSGVVLGSQDQVIQAAIAEHFHILSNDLFAELRSVLDDVRTKQQDFLDKQQEVLRLASASSFVPETKANSKLQESARSMRAEGPGVVGAASVNLLVESIEDEKEKQLTEAPPQRRRVSASIRVPGEPGDGEPFEPDDPGHGTAARNLLVNGVEDETTVLRNLLVLAEECDARDEVRKGSTHWERTKKFYAEMNAYQFEMGLDSVMGAVIMGNAIFIGLGMTFKSPEAEGSFDGWFVIDLMISIIFITELCVKLKLHGVKGQFAGEGYKMNCFDGMLVFIDTLQLILTFANNGGGDNGPVPASLFRLVRLVRLMRLLKVVSSPIFADLMSMVQGIMGAIMTLGWAFVLLAVVVYFFALVFMQLLGVIAPPVPEVSAYFATPMRAMLTVFRCSFGDCSTSGGLPLFEQIWIGMERGIISPAYLMVFVGFGFFVWVGLFNVISAIFVESTMAAAAALANNKRSARLANKVVWARNIATLVRILWERSGHDQSAQLSGEIEAVMQLDVPCSVIEQVVTEEPAINALLALDINADDHAHLADILDPDNGGSLTVAEMIEGIGRLRGDPRRSDIISIDLMIRALQASIADVHRDVKSTKERLQKVSKGFAQSCS